MNQLLMSVGIQRVGSMPAADEQQLAGLRKGAKSEYVQLQASKDLLDRAGFKPIDRSQVQVAGDIRVSIDLS